METQCKLIVTYQPFKNNISKLKTFTLVLDTRLAVKYRLDIVFLSLHLGNWLSLKKYLWSSQVVRRSRCLSFVFV